MRQRFRSTEPREILSRARDVFSHIGLAFTRQRVRPVIAAHREAPSLFTKSEICKRVANGEKNGIRLLADGWLNHRGNLFALVDAQFGDPIDWHCDYSSGVIGPKKYSAFINHRNAGDVGDVKYIWELNRLQHLVSLALASRWTGVDAYDKEIEAQLLSWKEQNPFMIGLNWKSPLEAALRLIAWAFVSFLWRDSNREDIFRKELLETIYRHQYFISNFYSKHSSANNHVIGEMAGLYVASVFWPFFRESDSWRAFARQRLGEEIVRQVEDDGVGKERATEYQLFILEFFILAGALGHAIGDPFPHKYWNRIERMATFLANISDRNGNLPLLGDGDTGQITGLPHSTEERVCSILRIFQFEDRHRGHKEEDLQSHLLLWGRRPDEIPLTAARKPERELQAFPQGGYYVLANNRSKDDELLVVFDAGPLGFAPLYAHGHADALSFWLSYAGLEFLIDPGTFTYYTNEEWREYFRSTAAHNTLRIDGLDQSVPGGRFLWRQVARSHAESAERNDEFVSVTGVHDGYRRLSDPVIHRRQLTLHRKNRRLIVTDFLECKGNHDIEIFFHFSAQCRVSQRAAESFTALNGGRALTVCLDPRLQPKLWRGSEQPILGWVSRRFGVKEPTFTLAGRTAINGSTEFVSEIIPL